MITWRRINPSSLAPARFAVLRLGVFPIGTTNSSLSHFSLSSANDAVSPIAPSPKPLIPSARPYPIAKVREESFKQRTRYP